MHYFSIFFISFNKACVIFRVSGKLFVWDTQIVGKFSENFEMFWLKFIRKMEFLTIFGKGVVVSRGSGKSIIFLQHSFPFPGEVPYFPTPVTAPMEYCSKIPISYTNIAFDMQIWEDFCSGRNIWPRKSYDAPPQAAKCESGWFPSLNFKSIPGIRKWFHFSKIASFFPPEIHFSKKKSKNGAYFTKVCNYFRNYFTNFNFSAVVYKSRCDAEAT